ncbi:putative transcriptional regulator, TetR family [Gordonia polyisoprenivorans VH2]|uniref:TetR/AcrR family transcriptional regulator n=2 Tax=Gordonia polyisoprenivorans TaxID=84595 RepID=A0A846WKE4_9ACTN|nr:MULTISPECIES: TetR/AcrR family transcriptional regulator [Gordonia]AFA74721.1 putative transcriptional regulator, TetR family [Gordonia polyisoprenivorans VH2]MDF3283476.1 helix-turn-helix domain containing protein [Gordonia sp. N1V]NKY02154.1 TetR/AcrR family transcriptional regulator [Gordonia polyisoprenivorans]OPX13867.1 TetR family transcriptional regulator [Gordonia sp. i37]OZC31709.1 TetR/AcrR family transcriptional regulator [Gordonia polyisoprenivorans]
MSSPVSQESTRRRLSAQQAETVARLTDAAVDVLNDEGFDGLTVRVVAKRAGVAPATAYTYFSSKSHLVAEVFWRRLADGVPDPDPALDPADRVAAVLRDVSLVVAGEGQLGGAVTVALLGTDPDVEHLRLRIGGFIRQRLAQALEVDPENPGPVVDALEMLYAGGLVHAGMGHLSYEQTSERLVAAAHLLMEKQS